MNHNQETLTLKQRQIKAAREWVKECIGCWRNIETSEDVDALSDAEIENGIKHEFGSLLKFWQATGED